MKPQLLINILFRGFRLMFYLTIIFLSYLLIFEAFSKNGTLGNFHSESHHSLGYPVPVKVKNSFRKPIFNNKHTINIKKGHKY